MVIVDRPAAFGNYASGRKRGIDTIVIHTMEGTFDGTCAWFANPDARVSAHFGISVDGQIARFVREEDTAWHAGNPDYNARSVGIELEGHCDDPDAFTPAMLDSLVWLCDRLTGRFSAITSDRQHFVGHCEVPDPRGHGLGGAGHHKDPGAFFPWDRLMSSLGRQA